MTANCKRPDGRMRRPQADGQACAGGPSQAPRTEKTTSESPACPARQAAHPAHKACASEETPSGAPGVAPSGALGVAPSGAPGVAPPGALGVAPPGAAAAPQAVRVEPFSAPYQDQVVELILSIQQGEFSVPVTIADQPDLLDIPGVYFSGAGHFWVALAEERVVGTLALLDIGQGMGALKKMFVNPRFRGQRVAQLLLEALVARCIQAGLARIWLGTTAKYLAAHRFYEKQGFTEVARAELPPSFPVMDVDTKFYTLEL